MWVNCQYLIVGLILYLFWGDDECKMKDLEKRKKILENIVKDCCNENNALIYLLIYNDKLNEVISRLDAKKTIPNTTSLVKKGYLSSEEQFIEVLYYVIDKIKINFWFLMDRNTIIELILNSKEALPLLLSKKYTGDNENILFYDFYVKRACVSNFYQILKVVDKNSAIRDFLKENDIDLERFSLDSESDVEHLHDVLRLICLCNYHSFQLLYIFDNKIDVSNKRMYQMQIELLIEKMNKVRPQAEMFLKTIL